jgi:hypothetical protein
MKIASVSVLKKELVHQSKEDLVELLNTFIKYSKENKELLNYLLFEADFEENYIAKIKEEIGEEFDGIDSRSWRTMKKSIQRILRLLKKYIKYSKKAETEIELLLFFCQRMNALRIPLSRNPIILNIYKRQLVAMDKALLTLHEDLQYDFKEGIEKANEVVDF